MRRSGLSFRVRSTSLRLSSFLYVSPPFLRSIYRTSDHASEIFQRSRPGTVRRGGARVCVILLFPSHVVFILASPRDYAVADILYGQDRYRVS